MVVSWFFPIMIPGCGFPPPLLDFQPHLHTFHCGGESCDMWIPSSPESQALTEAWKDRPFPRQGSHPVAVCQQETLAFIGLHQPGAEGPGSLPLNRHSLTPSPDPWHRTWAGSENTSAATNTCHLDEAQDPVGQRWPKILELSQSDLQEVGRDTVPVASQPPSPPISTDSSSPPSALGEGESLSYERSRSRDSGLRSPDLCPQRRTSQGSLKEKSIRRKIRVYSPESLNDDLLSGPSLECEYLFPRPSVEEELGFLIPPCTIPPTGGGREPQHSSPSALPLSSRGRATPAEGPSAGGAPYRPADQERRRFSASELISRLQLSQRKSSFALKLGKSLSARAAPRDRPPVHDKPHGRDHSSGGSGDGAPHGPTGAAPPVPPGEKTAHRGSSRPSGRKDSVDEDTGSPAGSGSKRLSRFLPSLLLYQEYSDVAINREIQRQQGPEPGGEEEGLGEATPPENLSPTSSFRSSRGSAFSLWQDIPDVRSSGMLDSFSNEERKLQEAKFELVTSEASYMRSLAIAVDHFMLSRELGECLGAQERQWLFSKLPDVKDVGERFLQDLEQRLEEDILRFDVCDIVLAHCPALRRVYLPYVTNQAYQEQTYQRLLQENPRFSSILARLEEHPICQRLPLTSFLILPFQRITRLKMLVEIIKECNSSVQSMKRTEELIHLNKKIHFEGKIFPLISQSRWLVKHGELCEVDTQTMSISGSKLKLPTRPVYLHLFNDCLLLSKKKDTWKFVVFVHAKIGELKVKDISQKLQGISGYIFHLQLCEGQLLKHQILLKARTESEKQRWITAMVPSDPEMSGDQIIENGDLSQVQCMKSYQAVEHDELTLEKADVLQVKNITSDGWVEGIRLSDGERGWFPKTYVEEITSRSARMRNLREKNRIKCATQKLEEEN
ncbi:rho guanine nucleotide exchange factor 19-like [Scleropages formosus]|uniref:Rho guanine nucleotide exchange factor 19-like n=1 Tax=Scleropages formosus TaxID=113540 RepID=A0A0P7UWN1_SCLFO|nr:rho guanine nucleotide exchange factor 19-like [Scleropages formosus]